jgi:enoyl-CoA hydratase/carnithine racemase
MGRSCTGPFFGRHIWYVAPLSQHPSSTDRIKFIMGDDGIAQVKLNQADQHNALDSAMFDALIDTGAQLSAMKGVCGVVLSGEGSSFSAGLDLSMFETLLGKDAPQLAKRTHGNANSFQQIAMTWRKLPVTVIAAVHSVCLSIPIFWSDSSAPCWHLLRYKNRLPAGV